MCHFSNRNGDLDELSKHGSLYEYLLHLHQNGQQPITMFWWGQQRVVSICSPELFKDTIKLTNRPSESDMYIYILLVYLHMYVSVTVCTYDLTTI